MRKHVLDYFHETVRRTPDKAAILHHGDAITFSQLAAKSRILANEILRSVSVDGSVPVAVFLPKSIEVVVADIAVMYSANFFSNLDVKTPIERIRHILEVMRPAVLITNHQYKPLLERIEGLSIPVVNIDDVLWEEAKDDENRIEDRLARRIDTDPFCIINTSGSTGTPKGVVLNHRSFFDFLHWSFDAFHFDGSEIIGALSPVVFDIYDFELCLMMFKGATIVLLDATLAAFPVKLLTEMREKRVNFIFWVPTIMVNIANMRLLEKMALPDLKIVWFAGEVFPTKQFNVWKRHLPHTTFANLYGPIEITLDCIYHVVPQELDESKPLPIGRPCKNTDVLLLNEADERCAPGELGEICVRGTSLAMGYYNNPEKTAAVFVQNPLNHSYPELIYRTGDLAYWNEEGLLIFKGRKDSLIKHMGYRIELGEIEHVVVNTLKLVKNCCVVYDFMKKEIVLFYETTPGVSDLQIRKALGQEFPRYMVPMVYHAVEELPRNTNGKIDRLKLTQTVNQ
ncbi:MAG: amino acid adenylation domain-containing protein [Schwartzia sp. (in: firmicutes)]